jgi:hypothetical protein
MPNFSLSLQIDNRKSRTDRQPTSHEIYFNQLLENFPKLDITNMTIKEIEDYAERYIQIHSLRCKICKSESFKTCSKIQLLINITEIF